MKKSITKKEFQVPSVLSEVQKASEKVLGFLRPLALSEAFLFDIRLCLEEALINAMKYGNKLREDLAVRLEAEYDQDEVRIRVEDQGEGFEPGSLRRCTEGENLLRNSGRGVYLIHQLMDKVVYSPKGNSVLMVKFLRKAQASPN